jgi:replication-associated recombination protein RarA
LNTIGREQESKEIISALRRKVNVLVISEIGLGKTHLLKEVKEQFGDDAYYIPALQPAKGTLTDALVEIKGWSEEEVKENKLTRKNLKEIAEMLIDEFSTEGFVLIIDSLDKVTAAQSEWLTKMAEQLTLLGAAREVKSSQQLKRFFSSFRQKIQLKPLSDEAIEELLKRQIKQRRIAFKNQTVQRDFVHQAIKAVRGVPLAVIELCKEAASIKQVTKTFVEAIKPHDSAVKYIDASPLFIILLTSVLALRYLSRGMGSYETYLLFSTISLFVYKAGGFLIQYFSKRK